jgi:hypothetical protein
MMSQLWRNHTPPIEPPQEGKWVVDVPPRAGVRLGPFKTRADALDYQLDYLIRQFEEADLTELPF